MVADTALKPEMRVYKQIAADNAAIVAEAFLRSRNGAF
jgi:hypothetical protein